MVYQVPISISIQWKYDETLGEFVEETWDWSKEFDVIRTFNRRSFSSKRSPSLVKAKFNAVAQNREDSLLSILLILMVILLLLAFSASFNASVEKLVVDPLKRIITSLRESGKAILESVNATAAFEDSKEDNSDDSYDLEEDEGHEEVMETDLLEIMVAKLARIVNHTVPGGNKKLIDNMHVDADTAEWLTKEYLTEESNTPRPGEAPRRMSRMTTLKMMRSTKMMTADQQRMDDWHLDPMALGNEEKFRMIAFMFQAFDIREEFQVPDEKLMGFLTLISSKYAEAPTYHNWIHAFDVTHTVYRFVTLTSCHRIFSNLEIFSLMVAVVGHDVGHPGVNNNFLVATKNELAIVHNDRSPLENMHCATLYAILRDKVGRPSSTKYAPRIRTLTYDACLSTAGERFRCAERPSVA